MPTPYERGERDIATYRFHEERGAGIVSWAPPPRKYFNVGRIFRLLVKRGGGGGPEAIDRHNPRIGRMDTVRQLFRVRLEVAIQIGPPR